MIIHMATTSRPQQRYDHRLRNLVQRTGDLAIAVDRGVPRSTARGWLRAAPTVVVSLDVANRAEPELREEILKLQQRVEKLAAFAPPGAGPVAGLRVQAVGGAPAAGDDKLRILRAVDQARACIPLRAVLRFLRMSPSRFHAGRRRQAACALEDESSCPARHRIG